MAGEFDKLFDILKDGHKLGPLHRLVHGTGVSKTPYLEADWLDQKAKALMESMERMGLIKDGKLCHPDEV